jgi:predicted nucleic acid-binding protein
MTYALDTNTIIQILKGNATVDKRAETTLDNNCELIIPPFANYKILRGFRFKASPELEQMYNSIYKSHSVGEINVNVWNTAAQIYADLKRTNMLIEAADILITAFSAS